MRKKYKGLLAIVCVLMICLTSNMGTVNAATELTFDGWVQYGVPQGAVSETEFRDGKQTVTYYFSYDENGRIISKSTYVKTNERAYIKRDTYEYDERGNLLRETWYDGDGKVDYMYIYQYDELGQITGEGIVLDDGSYAPQYSYFYEGNKKMIWQNCYEKVIEVEEYDSEGKVISWQSTEEYPRKTEYEYDEKGRIVKLTYMETWDVDYDFKRIYEYTYDQYDNIAVVNKYASLKAGGPIFFANTCNYVRNYDEYGRLTQIGTIGFTGTFTGYTYTY